MPGTLFVVATPIGNLEDITLRALRILREVDVVAAEDTRRTSKLLSHYAIRKPLVSFHAHNEWREASRLVRRLLGGESMALVSDAGTPGIADPAAVLVRAARAAGIRIVPIPGPSAVTAALSVSGTIAETFTFLGFAPRGGTERMEWLERLTSTTGVAVFFEVPHRIERTLADIGRVLGERPVLVCREISKIHEDLVVRTRSAAAIAPSIRVEGEFVIVVGAGSGSSSVREESEAQAVRMFGLLTSDHSSGDVDPAIALEVVSRGLGIDRARLRKLLKHARYSASSSR